jgi:hypothetical protein
MPTFFTKLIYRRFSLQTPDGGFIGCACPVVYRVESGGIHIKSG